eukprot:augustus_masked-scaffold_45-processed-gene-0.2-mRNA-1 protein AED:1.00 eAED:1.00 QI:0/-1/0/0/-1/1/1/0/425
MTDLQKALSDCHNEANSKQARDFAKKLKFDKDHYSLRLREMVGNLENEEFNLFESSIDLDYFSRKQKREIIRWCVFFMFFHRTCFRDRFNTYEKTPFLTVFEYLGKNHKDQYIPDQVLQKQEYTFDLVVGTLSKYDAEEILNESKENKYELVKGVTSKTIWRTINVLPKHCLFPHCNVEDMIYWTKNGGGVPFLSGLTGSLINLRNEAVDKFIFLFLFDMCARKGGRFLAENYINKSRINCWSYFVFRVLYFIQEKIKQVEIEQEEIKQEDEDLVSFFLDCFYVLKHKYSGVEVEILPDTVITEEKVTEEPESTLLKERQSHALKNQNKTADGTSSKKNKTNTLFRKTAKHSEKKKGKTFMVLKEFFENCTTSPGLEKSVLNTYIEKSDYKFERNDIRNHSEELGERYGLTAQEIRSYRVEKKNK